MSTGDKLALICALQDIACNPRGRLHTKCKLKPESIFYHFICHLQVPKKYLILCVSVVSVFPTVCAHKPKLPRRLLFSSSLGWGRQTAWMGVMWRVCFFPPAVWLHRLQTQLHRGGLWLARAHTHRGRHRRTLVSRNMALWPLLFRSKPH